MRVHWTQNALKHLVDIYGYISENSKFYALRMVDRLTRKSEGIAAFPMAGRMVPEFQARDIRDRNEGIERPRCSNENEALPEEDLGFRDHPGSGHSHESKISEPKTGCEPPP